MALILIHSSQSCLFATRRFVAVTTKSFTFVNHLVSHTSWCQAASDHVSRSGCYVVDGAFGADSDFEGVDAVLRQGWAGGFGRKAW
jgi:hypothetical protein